MRSFNWESFLQRWSQEIIDAIGQNQAGLPSEVLKSGWLGYRAATEQQISRTESRLGTSLPPSYRAFLKVTNGWRRTSHFSNKLWSVDELEWFATRHQGWIDAFWGKTEQHPPEPHNSQAPTPSISDDEYFIYGDEQDCSKLRVEYLQTALEISQPGDGAIYLLNPQIVTPEGEWEAWFFGDWLPGADRYPSFQAMMQTEYENFLELRDAPNDPDDPDASAINAGPRAADAPAAPESGWHDLAAFTIEFQTQQRPGPSPQRSRIHQQETDATKTWSDIDVAAIQQWMLEQLPATADQTTPEPPVELEITQLRVLRALPTQPPMVVDRAQPLFADPIHQGEPFALEVSMNVIGEADPSLAERRFVYRAQCVAHHLTTQLDTDLGDITTRALGPHQSRYTAQFPEARLQQPGLYRLKVRVTLENSSASPGYFKVPVFQVV
ncbi:MAG: SMI1/KNR4 family protein [Elainellaceae cyanobacterium]